MHVCIPVNEDRGLASRVSEHFGSAPLFLIVDTERGELRPVVNVGHQHAHGACQPLAVLANTHVDAVLVGSIGAGALGKLRAAGIDVFLSDRPTVELTLAAFAAGELGPVDPAGACSHPRHGGRGSGGGGGRGRRGHGCGGGAP